MFSSFEIDHAIHPSVFGSVKSRSHAKGQFCILHRSHAVSYLIGLIFIKVSVCSRPIIILFGIMVRKLLLI